MAEYDAITGRVVLSEEEKQHVADAKKKTKYIKTELQRPADAVWLLNPDTAIRYTDQPQAYQEPPPAPGKWDGPDEPMPQTQPGGDHLLGGRIEVQREGEPQPTLRRAAPRLQLQRDPPRELPDEPDHKGDWAIDRLTYHRNGVFKVTAVDLVDGRGVQFGFEPYYDNYQIPRTTVQAIVKKLMKKFAENGIDVTAAARANKPELMEEMYQLLSVIMEEEGNRKYDPQWTTVKLLFDQQF